MEGSATKTIAIAGMTCSGTKALQQAFCTHHDLGYVHRLYGRFPRLHFLASLHRLAAWSHRLLPRGKFDNWLSAIETCRMYHGLHPDFRDYDLTAADAGADDPCRWQEAARQLLSWQGRAVWVLQFEGWARADYVRHVLPGVRYIWVSRHPEDVGWSNYQQRNWHNIARLNSVDLENPRQALPFYVALAERLDGLGRHDLAQLGVPWLHVVYAEFATAPQVVLARCARFCGLDPVGFDLPILERLRVGRAGLGSARRPTPEERLLLARGRGQGERLQLAPYRVRTRMAA